MRFLESLIQFFKSKSETEGEWRCRCPYNQEFDTSINPSYVKACGKCGATRPDNVRLAP